MDQHSEQRRLYRHQIDGEISATVRETDHSVGKLIDVHRQGLLLECTELLISDKTYPLKLAMEGEVTMPWIALDTKCLWVAAVDGDFRAGCVIVDIEPEAFEVLRQLDL